MSNFFQLIQDISKVKLGRSPASFTATSNKKYDKIIEAIKGSLEDFFLDETHNFRRKTASFTTVANQQGYVNNYGVIDNDAIKIYDSDNNKYDIAFESNYQEVLFNTDTGIPTKYTILDEKILLYPIPDDAYTVKLIHNTDNWVKGVATIDQSSVADQANVYVTYTEGLEAGDTVIIEPNTAREETGIILSVTTDNYITLTENLTYTHASGNVEKYKKELEYSTDEPNFPSRFHKILEYDALKRLYYGQQEKLLKYTQLYRDKYKQIIVESRGSKDSTPRFRVG